VTLTPTGTPVGAGALKGSSRHGGALTADAERHTTTRGHSRRRGRGRRARGGAPPTPPAPAPARARPAAGGGPRPPRGGVGGGARPPPPAPPPPARILSSAPSPYCPAPRDAAEPKLARISHTRDGLRRLQPARRVALGRPTFRQPPPSACRAFCSRNSILRIFTHNLKCPALRSLLGWLREVEEGTQQ
jgi:hypothetical protein